VILRRCFAWDRAAAPTEEGGALWFPRVYQGDGRHDNPDAYGCLYVAEEAVSAIVEQLARFRGSVLVPEILVRRGLPLGVASLELDDGAPVVDLDRPAVLEEHGLRPSRVATRHREVTQPQALALYHGGAAGLRWWSTFEASWANVTLFDRATPRLHLVDVRGVGVDDPAVREAADLLGIAPAGVA
jgi:hypothetical protein